VRYRNNSRGAWPAIGFLALAFATAPFVLSPAHADWRQDAKEAALKYADQKKDELVKTQSKAAIVALYKRLYAAKSKINPKASRALAEVAMAAPDLEKMAEDMADAYGSGDPEKIRAASETVAVKFGEQLARLGSNAESRALLGSMIGKADKVKEISQMLGNATSGTKAGKRAAAEYLGEALIGLTPAAGVIGFYQASVGAMKYAKGEYTDSKVEDLYKAYKNGDAKARELILEQVRAGTGGYAYVIGERRRDLEEQKIAAIGDAADQAGDAVREHLTKTTEEEIIASIVASFEGRIAKEDKDKAQKAARDKAQKEADAILTELADTAAGKDGVGAMRDNPYNLEKYISVVRDQFENIPELDPNNLTDLKLISRTLSAGLVYGKNSKEYAAATAALQEVREIALAAHKGAPCTAGSQTQQLALRLWEQGKRLAGAGQLAEGVSALKKSLEFCPDARRAAQVAALAKGVAEPAQGFDGQYVGRGSYGIPGYEQTVFTLRLTIAGERVTGSFVGSLAKAKVTQNGTVVGRVSPDGHIVATLTGQSRKAGAVSGGAPVDSRDVNARVGAAVTEVMAMVFNYPFTAQLDGRIAGKTASGSLSLRRTSKPLWKSPKAGKWSISRE
jgi:hypothetical protein